MKPTTPFLEVVPPLDPDPELERVLSAARTMAEPELVNRARVSAALQRALSPPSESSLPRSGEWPELLAPLASQVKAPAPLPAASRAVRAPLAWLLLGGAVIGSLGFWLGHGVGHAAGWSDALAARATEVNGAPLRSAPLSEPPPEPSSRSLTAAGSPTPAAPDGDGARASKPSDSVATVTSTSRAGASGTKRAGASAMRAPAPEARAMSFREVLEGLRRARQQLDNGQATLSLLLLSELDRGAGDLLGEEREVTRVLALCATGQDEAARRAAGQLSRQSPRSIYATRLSSSCVARAGDAD